MAVATRIGLALQHMSSMALHWATLEVQRDHNAMAAHTLKGMTIDPDDQEAYDAWASASR